MTLPGGADKNTSDVAAPPVKTSAAPGQAAPTAAPPLAVTGQNFGPVIGDVLKAQNYGPLENQETLVGCLKGGKIPASKPLGVSPIQLDDKAAVMAILPGGGPKPGTFRIVVLDPKTCGPDNPNGVLADSPVTP